ncbi:MAG: hypothetical protein K2W92_06935 [Alphaproteobacteria bacterium]|nr:hypothetical protein [Alphaproteobacteria bacterium]
MVLKKRKKMRLMTALMLGATVFSPAEKALGMESDEDLVTSRRTVAGGSLLVGDTVVPANLRSAARPVLTFLEGGIRSSSTGQRIPIKSDLIEPFLTTLHKGGIQKVMARYTSSSFSNSSEEDPDALIKGSLEALMQARKDPLDEIVEKSTRAVHYAFGMRERKEALAKCVTNIDNLKELFANTLPRVMAETPDIVNAIAARLPRFQKVDLENPDMISSIADQKERARAREAQCLRIFEDYFKEKVGDDKWIPKLVKKTPAMERYERNKQKNPNLEYDGELTQAAEMYGLALQREKGLMRSAGVSSVASSPSISEPASSNDVSPVKDRMVMMSSRLGELLKIPQALTLDPQLVEEEPSVSGSSSHLTEEDSAEAKAVPVKLGRAVTNPAAGAVITEESGVITVRTDNRGLHKYQLESERIPVKPGDRLKVSYNITSSEDGIILDLLSTHGNHWFSGSKVNLKEGPQQGTFEVGVPEGESVPRFVFYNNQTSTPSTEVRIHSLSVELLPTAVSVPLRKASYNPSESVVIEESGIITVRTDNRGLHKYQLESERIPVKPGDHLKVSYNITSSEDGIVLGLLNTHRAGWLPDSRVSLRGGSQEGIFDVVVPEGESAPFFVFYNDQTRTPSTEVTIHSLRIEKEEVKK